MPKKFHIGAPTVNPYRQPTIRRDSLNMANVRDHVNAHWHGEKAIGKLTKRVTILNSEDALNAEIDGYTLTPCGLVRCRVANANPDVARIKRAYAKNTVRSGKVTTRTLTPDELAARLAR